jgi:hypothetical protein
VDAQPIVRARPSPVFVFEALDALPCGCVTSAFRSAEWGVSLVSVEAKGPYCPRIQHFVGQVLNACAPADTDDGAEEECAAALLG